MGKSKDLATGETRFVNTAGDTMTGNLAINNASGSQVTLHRTDTTIANDDLLGQVIISGDDADTNASGTRGFIRGRSQGTGRGLKMEFGTAGGGVAIGDPRMTINADGYVTKPKQPCFLARGNTGSWVTVSSGAEQNVAFGNVVFDLANNFSTSTNRFTAPVAGKYLFHFHCYMRLTSNDDDTNYATTRFYKNGSVYENYHNILGYNNSGDSDQIGPLTAIIDLAATDYVTAGLKANSGNAEFYQPNCNFTGYLLG